MKRIATFIVLLCHINFTMFLPTVEEQDMFNADGTMVDDINSVCEYVEQVLLGHKDDTPEDEDDDQPHFYQVAKASSYFYQQIGIEVKQAFPNTLEEIIYYSFDETILPSPAYDIVAPPPQG